MSSMTFPRGLRAYPMPKANYWLSAFLLACLLALPQDGSVTSPEQPAFLSMPTSGTIGEEAVPTNPKLSFADLAINGENIAQIPCIEYEGPYCPAIESINDSFQLDVLNAYAAYADSPTGEGEARKALVSSFLYSSSSYLGAVAVIEPGPGSEDKWPALCSFCYDIASAKALTLQDAMAMAVMDEAAIHTGAKEAYEAQHGDIPKVLIASAEGFLLYEANEGRKVEFLVRYRFEGETEALYIFRPEDSEAKAGIRALESESLALP